MVPARLPKAAVWQVRLSEFRGRLFPTRGPAAVKALSPKLVRVRLTTSVSRAQSSWAGVGDDTAVVTRRLGSWELSIDHQIRIFYTSLK